MLSDELERKSFEACVRATWKVPKDYLDWALKVKDGAYQDSRAQDQWSGWIAKTRAIERESTTPLLEQIKEDEALMQQVLAALEESRDDVVSSLNNLEHGKGYPSYDRRIQRITEQLSKHDAVIEALRQRLEAKK